MSEPTGLQVMLDQWDKRGMAAQAYPETFIEAFVKAARLVANGELIQWCEYHRSNSKYATEDGRLICEGDDTKCRMVPKLLVTPGDTEDHDYLLSPFFPPTITPEATK